MAVMTTYNYRKFEKILFANGYKCNRNNNGHRIYIKDGVVKNISIPAHSRDIAPCITARLIQENNLII